MSRRGRSANAHSDELLVKCLAKGHELLRKVENINGGKAMRPSRGVSKKKQQLHKQLQFASEEKVGKPKLESCKIIPPKLGETSDKNHELLVKVVQQKQQQQKQHQQKKSLEQSVSDSDDSGHISNAAMHSSASSNASSSALNSTSNSTGSLCESEVEVEVEREPEAEHEVEVLACRPNKIAELLEKFEAKSKKGQLRVVSKVQAQVQAVRCIQTQVEIYPTYTKEVTMRLH